LGFVKKIKNIYFCSCHIVALFILYTPNMIKTDTDVTMDKLILQAKRLALVEMQLKIAEEVAVIDNLITDIENKNEDSIPF
jgi:hypothetical protein